LKGKKEKKGEKREQETRIHPGGKVCEKTPSLGKAERSEKSEGYRRFKRL